MIRRSGRRFAEKIMRHLWLARDRTQNRLPLLLVARVPLIDLKFLNELAAGDAGTSNRRH
jgi:hypothetical protein